uniref:Akirin n=1 Tax=Globodera pallida TaxID=36090 RepID=A0A183CAD0_GLOPA
MTCGLAVKRPLDLGQDGTLVDVKRPRHSGASPQCSPFRPQLGILATSLMQSTVPIKVPTPPPFGCGVAVASSPFADVSGRCRLSSTQLDTYLRAEIQALKRRRLIPRRQAIFPDGDGYNNGAITSTPVSSTSAFRKASSPSSSNSGSDSETETMKTGNAEEEKRAMLEALYQKPQFSLRQVKLICERLLKEQEMRLRYEYETILNKKLEEQHEQYVQFAKEQLDTNAAMKGDDIPYLS